MKNLDLNSFGVQEMNALDMQETDGGMFWFVVIAAAAFLLCSCNNTTNIQIGGQDNSSTQSGGTMSADSSLNGNTVQVPLR